MNGTRRLPVLKVIDKPDGTKDWVTPQWFPIRRVSDDELESNEIDFQLRVNAVIEGRMTPEDAEKAGTSLFTHHIYIVYWYTKHPGPIVYSHHHHVYIVYWYTKHPGPIVYSHHIHTAFT